MKLVKKTALFGIGGGGYVCLELLYRGYSHLSMFAAGGTCFLLIGVLGRLRVPPIVKVLFGTMAVTTVELFTGLLVNRNYEVWDYRTQPGNFLGQICPQFAALWVPLTAAALGLYKIADWGLDWVLLKEK